MLVSAKVDQVKFTAKLGPAVFGQNLTKYKRKWKFSPDGVEQKVRGWALSLFGIEPENKPTVKLGSYQHPQLLRSIIEQLYARNGELDSLRVVLYGYAAFMF